ncbi:hypothetical protein HHK36_024898 [Tetracentron sinense]|uniref:Disease resistance protein RPM1-like n=1 Tax=Tetracentron sinense TaxID=13715 RepID=A0A834YL35_TETSI|nr:hypothetical protein HHK36_024898 [Tetracentron sinense]
MAMITVKFLLDKLGSLLSEEVQLLGGVRKGVEEIQDELESMKSFLQDADTRSESDQGVKTWVKQVRDVAYDTEDVFAEFLVRLAQPQGHGSVCYLHSCFRYVKQLKARRHLAIEIQNIMARIRSISERRKAYDFNRIIDEGTSANSSLERWHDPRLASLFIDEADVVGIEKPRELLLRWLIEGESKLTIISVVGMGGLGKTTLVKKAYDNKTTKGHFDCQAWITVSKTFTIEELLRTAVRGFLEATKEPVPEGLDTMSDIQLGEVLKDHLQQKRYVIIFDDVWSINAWEAMKYALPDSKCGSRIIFTTRKNDVAASVENTTGHVYHLQPLSQEEAWTLFCMKAFRSEHDQGSCPEELEELSLSILKKCSGLPLAIVAIGGLLSKKEKTVLEWKKVLDSLGTEMRSNCKLESLGRILLLSFNNLPYHLKSCYLYLSVFPEDHLIKRTKLTQLWAAEGFVEEKQGLTLEEVAVDYLNELVSRSMIQVAERDDFDKVKYCRVHDLMREIIQLKSREDCFITVVDHERGMKLDEKVRRMSIHDTTCENFLSDIRFRCLHSLLVFKSTDSSCFFGHAFFCGFRLLRVLDLERAPLSKFPAELVGLVHLRFLSLRRTMVRQLPKSVEKLRNLEILDLKGTPVSTLPSGILKMERLRQICNYHYRFVSSNSFATCGMVVPPGIGRLTNLQKLGVVEVNQGSSETLRELGMLTQLRRLGISKLRREDGMDLCTSLEKMKHLTSLYTVSIRPNEFLQLESLSSPPPLLQHLFLKACLTTLPVWISSLRNLVKLVLQHSRLKDDPLNALQEMPNLVSLELRHAYDGEELCCEARGYPRLKKLSFFHLEQLKRVKMAEGAMPRLRRMEITSCRELETVPLGIEHLNNLQELHLWGMPYEFLKKMGRPQGEDCWKVQHITTIKHFGGGNDLTTGKVVWRGRRKGLLFLLDLDDSVTLASCFFSLSSDDISHLKVYQRQERVMSSPLLPPAAPPEADPSILEASTFQCWRDARTEELQALVDNHTLDLVSRP